MTNGSGNQVFSDAAWAVWEPLIEEVRPRGKTPPKELRRTISAVFWRHRNGAKWRSIPAELGPPREPLDGSRPAGRMIGAADHGGWQRSCSSGGRGKAYGIACSSWCSSVVWPWA
jgi:transposase